MERDAAMRLLSWLGLLAQAPALRELLCVALLQPATPSAAAQAGSLAATAGLPPELAAVARMLQQQREALLERLAAVLPVPGDAEGEAPGAAGQAQRRPLPLPRPGPHQLSLLYWQLSTLLLLEGHLVEVRRGGAQWTCEEGVPAGPHARRCSLECSSWLLFQPAAMFCAAGVLPSALRHVPLPVHTQPRIHLTRLASPGRFLAAAGSLSAIPPAVPLPLSLRWPQELATLHILLLYSVPFKTQFGRALLCFYPHLGGERSTRLAIKYGCTCRPACVRHMQPCQR